MTDDDLLIVCHTPYISHTIMTITNDAGFDRPHTRVYNLIVGTQCMMMMILRVDCCVDCCVGMLTILLLLLACLMLPSSVVLLCCTPGWSFSLFLSQVFLT